MLLIFLSCASVTPASLSKKEARLFKTIEDVYPRWLLLADAGPEDGGVPVTGIAGFYGKIKSPHLVFWALRIDLTSPDTQIVVRGGAAGEDGQTLSTRVSSFVKDNNLSVGVNSLPFNIVSYKERQPLSNIGIVISDGELLSPAHSGYDALVFYKDGKAAVVSQAELMDAEAVSQIENAVGGFNRILTDGKPSERTDNLKPRHPRTAAGISDDGKHLYLLIIDGRRLGSFGATEKETALILRQLGSLEGINMDGGGSTTLAVRYGGKVRIVNIPIHKGIPGLERAVAGCLGVRILE